MSPGTIGGGVGLVVWLLFRSHISSALGYEGGFNLVLLLLAGLFGGVGGGLGALVGNIVNSRNEKANAAEGRRAILSALRRIGVDARMPEGTVDKERPGPSIDVEGGPIEWIAVTAVLEKGSYVIGSSLFTTCWIEPAGLMISFDETDSTRQIRGEWPPSKLGQRSDWGGGPFRPPKRARSRPWAQTRPL